MTGFLSCNEPLIHFGLGNDKVIRRVTVTWPSQAVQTFDDLEANHYYVVTEPDSNDGGDRSGGTDPSPMFRQDPRFPSIPHREDNFDDFAEQELLPNRMSQFGPGMAWGDIDADGDDDLFVGNGAGHPASLWRNDGSNGFRQLEAPALSAHDQREDLGTLFFDANGDGRLDLYVVSGGTMQGTFQDRLYLQHEDGEFVYEPSALPTESLSGSTAAAADFDRDGDLDLFVGSRLVPGRYPLAPRSQLLRNDNGRFTEVIDSVASELAETGMVTSALWSDLNGDQWPDLAIALEWGPVRVFYNRQGRLQDATETLGIATYTGWWNGLSSGDVDNDGDIDLVATNAGLNTKYHAGAEHPALLYYGDFDQTGRFNLVEAEYEGDQLYPIRGKSCSTHAMPVVGERFDSYRDFALADLAQIYTTECLENAFRLEATTLASGVFRNDGDRFTFLPLPRSAQTSAAFAQALADMNADGHLDLYLVHNFFGPQPETGRWDSGVSLLMRGQGNGEFVAVWPNQSGLYVPDDATGVAIVDLNDDARPDLVVASNQGPTKTLCAAIAI